MYYSPSYKIPPIADFKTVLMMWVMTALLSACSGESFHLRGSVVLPDVYKRVYLQGGSNAFRDVLRSQLDVVGSQLVTDVNDATAIFNVINYREGKRVAGYGSNREVREYLIFLRFDFSTKTTSVNDVSKNDSKPNSLELISLSKINLDKVQIYDSAFVLGKIEEERLIRDDLRKSAARQFIRRLQYGKH